MMKYIGGGNWLPHFPARDLTTKEVKELGGEEVLLAKGLYERPKPSQQKPASAKAKADPTNKEGEQ